MLMKKLNRRDWLALSLKAPVAAHWLPRVSVLGLATSSTAVLAQGAEATATGALAGPNADGSIPAYAGGLTKPPAGWSADKGYVDPFPQDKPLYTITAANAGQYAALLTPGVQALLKRQPSFQMPVYQTRRTAALPATAKGTVPFPQPKTGEQAMQNHLNRYAGGGYDREYAWFPVRANGEYYKVGYADTVVYAENFTPSQKDSGLQFAFMSRYTAPAALAGTVYLVHEFEDPIKNPRAAWVYNAGQRRVRRAPDLAYDNVADGTEGMRVTDQYFAFNGALDRYDWKLLGRKEMLVPYNTYKVGSKSLKYADVIGKGTAKSDLMRYEKHRVWVVEATLKKDSKHIYGKRVFLLDEDSWVVLQEDCYDTRGEIWRVGLHGFIQCYDVGVPWYSIQMWHDLNNGSVLISHLDNEVTKPIQFGVKASWSDFQTDALRRRGTR
jgi:hypothetical protein